MRVRLTRISLLVSILLALSSCGALLSGNGDTSDSDGQAKIFTNGVRTTDTDGNEIFGSGGCMLQVGKYFYWYGEHRFSSGNFKGVACYRSTNMVDWEFRGDILSYTDSEELNPALVERPKVIYNATTKKYVLWMHLENANWDYGLAKAAVSEGDSPDGHFEYKWSFRPFEEPEFDIHDNGTGSNYYSHATGYNNEPYGYMSRDCTLFVDDDGEAYFASSYSENTKMHIYRLTDDYLKIDTTYFPTHHVLQQSQREAPCLFKRNGYYYMISSGTSGWAATVTTIQYATDLRGPWSSLVTVSDTSYTGDNTHFDRSQPAYVFKLVSTDGVDADGDGKVDCTYMYMGDRWGPAFGGSSSFDSQFVWAPIVFTSDTSVNFTYSEALKMDPANGVVTYPQYYKLACDARTDASTTGGTRTYMVGPAYYSNSTASNMTMSVTTTAPTSNYGQWRLVPATRDGYYYLVNRASGKAMTADATPLTLVQPAQRENELATQWWKLSEIGDSYYSIQSYYSGYYLSMCSGLSTTTISANGIYQLAWKYRDPTWVASTDTYDLYYNSVISLQSWKLIPVSN